MFKEALKHIPVAARINAAIKAERTKFVYRQWCSRYKSLSILDFGHRTEWSHRFAPSWSDNNISSVRITDRRFFFVGTSWDQDRSGLVQGLRAHGELGIFCGPDGKNELRLPKNAGDVEACREANRVSLNAEFKAFAAKGPVSALVGQMWNFAMPAAALLDIRASGVPIVNIAMDDRHSFHKSSVRGGGDGGVAGLVSALTLGATAAPECVSWYETLGVPAVFFPEASDGSLFHQFNLPKLHDITFVGANYGFRGRIVAGLRRAGLRVTTYGSGWAEGRIQTEAIPELFSRSRIVLGIGAVLHCHDFTALKLRDFDAPMSGSFYLTQENPDLGLVYRLGDEIETWRDLPQLIEKCRKYLADDTARERIAAAGHARAVAEHTWTRRFSVLLRQLEALTPSI